MKNSTCIALVFGLASMGFSSNASAQFSYPDFSSTTGLNMVGSASQAGDRLRITPDAQQQTGSAWYQTLQPVAGGFTTTFTFQYSNIAGSTDANGNHGCDGISFQVQPTSSTLEYTHPIAPPDPGISVLFDAFDNNVPGTDISSSRVDVGVDGASLGQTDVESLGIIFRDEAVHTAQIDFDGSNLDVYLDGQFVVAYGGIDLGSASPAYAGFGGYAGGAYADQDVLSWSFVPEPAALSLLAVGAVAILKRKSRPRRGGDRSA